MKKTILFLFASLMIVGCGENLDNRVFGKWVEDTSYGKSELTFNEDGTYTAFYPSNMRDFNSIKDINDKGTYTTKDMQNPKKYKNGGCVIVLNSEYGNNYELDFVAYEKGDSCMLQYYKINKDRDGNISTENDYSYMGLYLKK